jgi:hypothetical protein
MSAGARRWLWRHIRELQHLLQAEHSGPPGHSTDSRPEAYPTAPVEAKQAATQATQALPAPVGGSELALGHG